MYSPDSWCELPELLQNIRPRSLGFMIHSVVKPRSACHDFHQAFSSSPRPGVDKLWFIVARFNHHEAEAALVSKNRWRLELEAARKVPEKF